MPECKDMGEQIFHQGGLDSLITTSQYSTLGILDVVESPNERLGISPNELFHSKSTSRLGLGTAPTSLIMFPFKPLLI